VGVSVAALLVRAHDDHLRLALQRRRVPVAEAAVLLVGAADPAVALLLDGLLAPSLDSRLRHGLDGGADRLHAGAVPAPQVAVARASGYNHDVNRTVALLSQHQLSSLVATAVDYAIMIACVSAFGLSPVVGTVLGALC